MSRAPLSAAGSQSTRTPSEGPRRALSVTQFRIEQWRAWAPGLDSAADWHAWQQAPFAPRDSGEQPDVSFLPALQRRRLSRLARMAFHVAWPLADAAGPLPLVFASRHGETPRTLAILSDLAHDEPLSPTQFSLSVHNAIIGLWSIQRGDTSEMTALAAEGDGILKRSDVVAETITEWKGDPNKSRASLLQLLSLQSGLSTNPDYKPADVSDLDTYQLAIDDPANYAPGQAFIYDPLAFQAFALMFERRSAGTDPIDYLQDRIFGKLGISAGDYVWQRDAENHPQMAGGASISAPVWARYGQMILQNGTWQGTRVLPAQGVKDCLTYENPAYLGYGITWWLNRDVGGTYDPSIDMVPADGLPTPGSSQIAPRAPADMVMAAGTGHQRMYLLPTQRLVVVRLAPLSTELDEWSDDEFLARLLGVR